MQTPPPNRLAVLAAAVTVLLWAAAFVVIRFCGADFSPGAMAFIRLSIGTIALVAVAAIYRPPLPPTILGFVGGALALGGVAISRRRGRQRVEPRTPEPAGADRRP